MAHSFAGVAFHTEQQEGTSVPILPAEAVLATEHVAGGDLDITQNLGKRGAVEVTYALVILAANWAAFVALIGQSGTLALIANSGRTATLTKLQNGRWFEAEGIYKVSATWLVG